MGIEMISTMNDVLDGLGIKATCTNVKQHRHLAYFDLNINPKTSLRKIENFSREIALGIRSKTIPIIKTIPELGIVRLQVAMTDAKPVSMISSYKNQKIPNLVFPIFLGEDECGNNLWMDMSKNPHLLIGGGTGSGKSVTLHTIISNALYLDALRFRNVELYLTDPKQVEFNFYSEKLFQDVVYDITNTYNGVCNILKYLFDIMEGRYAEMSRIGMRSIEEDPNYFPLILFVVDEVSDLILQDSSKVFRKYLISLAQKARAAGIFLILATQRPSVDIITGLIKANFPGRIACKTSSRIDSQVILDEVGAETLLGRGDALLKNMEYDRVRFQVAYTNEKEIKSVYSSLLQVTKA